MPDQPPVVHIARCPEHGLHGRRDTCFECGGPVEQVPMVPVGAFTVVPCQPIDLLAAADRVRRAHRGMDGLPARATAPIPAPPWAVCDAPERSCPDGYHCFVMNGCQATAPQRQSEGRS